DEHAVTGAEGEVPEDRFRLVGEEELQRVMPDELDRGRGGDGDDRVRQRGLGATGADDEPCDAGLFRDYGAAHELGLAVEVPVESRTRAARLTGDVVE